MASASRFSSLSETAAEYVHHLDRQHFSFSQQSPQQVLSLFQGRTFKEEYSTFLQTAQFNRVRSEFVFAQREAPSWTRENIPHIVF